MYEWFKSLVWYEQALWLIAVVFTFLFFVQFFFSVVQKSGKKIKSDNLIKSLLSIQSITIFLSMFGWVNIACIYQGFTLKTALIISILSGMVMVVMMAFLNYFFKKMKSGESTARTQKINSTGEVLSDIGRKRSIPGKILININGVNKEMVALTDFDHDIKKGTKIEVESVIENGTLIIKPLQ